MFPHRMAVSRLAQCHSATESSMSDPVTQLSGFILTRGWRDTRDGLEYVYWVWTKEKPVRVRITAAEAVCFVDREAATAVAAAQLPRPDRQRSVELCSLQGAPVDACYFRKQADLVRYRDAARIANVPVFETDLKPADRYLMERFVTGGCEIEGNSIDGDGFVQFNNPQIRTAEIDADLSIASIDIETADFDGALYSIAVSSADDEVVFLVDEKSAKPNDPEVSRNLDGDARLICLDSEQAVLSAFYDWINRYDPDVLVGWNVVAFDLDFIEKRSRQLGMDFAVGRGSERATILNPQGRGDTFVARIPGRVVLDGIDTLRAAFYNFEDFSLEAVANELLGRGKLIQPEADKVAEIRRLYREDKTALAAYNLEDCRLVRQIFDKTSLVQFARPTGRRGGGLRFSLSAAPASSWLRCQRQCAATVCYGQPRRLCAGLAARPV